MDLLELVAEEPLRQDGTAGAGGSFPARDGAEDRAEEEDAVEARGR
ncbi:hypothetical protein [Streptomyces roseolus]